MGTPSNTTTTTRPAAPIGEDYDRTISHGERTLNLLKRLRTPATPRNYELLFAFTTATNKELCKARRWKPIPA